MGTKLDEKELGQILQRAVNEYDPDWIVYQLVQGAVAKRAEVDEGTNKAEKAYWQKMVVALNEFQSKLEDM